MVKRRAVTGPDVWGVVRPRSAGKNPHDSNSIIIEDGRDIFRGKFVGRVADEKTCLADSTVTDDDTPAE